MRILKLICRTAVLSLIAISAHAQNRAIMEGIAASNNTVFVSTPTSNLLVGATYYPSNLNAVLVPGSIYTTGHIHSGSGFYTVGNATAAVYYGNMQYMSGLAANTTFMANVAANAASTTSIYASLNSTGSALTSETVRAEAAESVLSASTVSVYVALNSTGSALTTETATRSTLATSVAASTTSIYSSINSTASALTTETARAEAAESVLSASTIALASQFVTNSSSMTNTSALGLLVASSVTASAFYGDASHLSNIPTGGAVTNTTTFQSSVTVTSSMTVIDSAAGDTYALIVATGTAASQQIVTVSTVGIVNISGAVDGSTSAAAGNWGEFISTGLAVSYLPASSTYLSLATTTLSAGDWDVQGLCYFAPGASFSGSGMSCCVSLSANTNDEFNSGTNSGGNGCTETDGALTGTTQNISLVTFTRRIVVTTPTAVYLTGEVNYSVSGGSPGFFTRSTLRATRVR